MNKQELISVYERISNFSENASTKKVIANLRKLDEPQVCQADVAPRYLRNVIARLRELPLHDREVWLKAIMDEFEQDFSHAKWREGYEQGKFEGAWVGEQLKNADKIRKELNNPVVPQYIADFITEQKKHGLTLSYSIDASMSDGVAEWYWDNPELFARAWLDGYDVEEEKRYYVRFKGMESGDFNYLNFIKFQHTWVLSSIKLDKKIRTEHTKKQLEESGFGWVFDCEGVELQEVE